MDIWQQLSAAGKELAVLSEIVLASRSPAELWPPLLDHLRRAVGFDAGYVATTRSTIADAQGAVIGHDAELLRQNIGRYLAEISPHEIVRYTNQARQDDDIWSVQRRERLSVFNELLMPAGTKHMLVRVSMRDDVLLGFNLERRLARPFNAREFALIDAVAPLIQAGDAFARKNGLSGRTFDGWADDHGLTSRERQVAQLVTRGMRNAEIGCLLGMSPLTVRNTLVRVFEKTDVTNRSELAFVATAAVESGTGRVVAGPEDILPTFHRRVRAASAEAVAGTPVPGDGPPRAVLVAAR